MFKAFLGFAAGLNILAALINLATGNILYSIMNQAIAVLLLSMILSD